MNHSRKRNLLLTALLFSGALAASTFAAQAAKKGEQTAPASPARAWEDVEIGAPTAAGSHAEKDGELAITGAGKGNRVSPKAADQMHYTYITVPAGDIDVIARVKSFTGNPKGSAGIMLRTGNDGIEATMALAAFTYKFVPANGHHAIGFSAFDQPTGNWSGSGVAVRQDLPLWIRLVRIGKYFGVYKSPDGKIWSMLGNTSGWMFAPEGPFEVGFYVASGDPAVTATATFDQITIGAPHLGYATGWYGNTFGGNVLDGHVANGIASLWVSPDGTCYTNSHYDEAAGSAMICKDGKVLRSFRDHSEMLGNAGADEGSITSDGEHIYMIGLGAIYKTDLEGMTPNPPPIYLSVSPFDEKNQCIISGLGVSNHEIFASDKRANLIRVAKSESTPLYKAGNTSVKTTTHEIDTAGVANAAPAAVYQSQRYCDYMPYVIPGLKPDVTYTVRNHFVEYTEKEPGKALITVNAGGVSVENHDVIAAAGAPFKADVLDIPGAKPDAQGNLTIGYVYGKGDHRVLVAGFEVLNPDGTQAFALNCGGGEIGAFKSEANELEKRAFPFTRPGPMAVDSRGDLWIIQQAHAYGGQPTDPLLPAAVKCYHPDGTFTDKQITDLVDPTAIAYDPVKDRLLVAENGPDQNVRIYNNLATTPAYAESFGVKGGIYAGAHPGQVHDPASGNWARFYGLSGVGIDKDGNIYVACASQGSDLRKLGTDGNLDWMLNGFFFCNTPSIDPDSDGTQAYSTYFQGSIDYAKPNGKEWSFTALNWNPALHGVAPNQYNSQAISRRVGPGRALVLYTSGQGVAGSVHIFRYDGNIAVPCGEIRGNAVWTDRNGDGIETPDEVSTCRSMGGISHYSVDNTGDVWLACTGTVAEMQHFKFLGLNEHGVPLYGTKDGEYEDGDFPGIGHPVSAWGQIAAINYDSDRDVMYLVGPAVPRLPDGSNNCISYLARYDHWSTGNRTARWLITLPDPTTDFNFCYEEGNPWGCAFSWMGFDVAGDRIFIAELWGPIHVYNAADGTLDTILSAGPEISGGMAWDDAAMGVTAYMRSNGEHVIFSENSGYNGKANMWRLPASGKNLAPNVAIAHPKADALIVVPSSVELIANAVDDDGSIAKVEFYNGKKLLGTATHRPYTVNWENVPAGTYAITAKATDNRGAATTSEKVTVKVWAQAPPTVNLISPANQATFTTVPAEITLTANAADSNGTVTKVEFYQGDKLIGQAGAAPFTYIWKDVPTGSYTFTAKATDNDKATTASNPVEVSVIKCQNTDLLSGLTAGPVPNGQNGWTRDPVDDGTAGNYGQFQFVTPKDDPAVTTPCLMATAVGSSGHMYAYRDLGANAGLAFWKISADLKFAYASLADKRSQVRILVKDVDGKIIANFDRMSWDNLGTYLKFNDQTVLSGALADTSALDAICNVWNTMSIEASPAGITLTYGGHTVSAPPMAGSNWAAPKTLCLMIGESNYYGETELINHLTFSTPEK